VIFFNSSMPRSGSTLLQNILGQNPSIHVTPTDGSLELLYGARTNFTNCTEFKAQDQQKMLAAWRGFCKGGLEGYVKGLSDRTHTCIKSRGIGIHYAWYSAFMGQAPQVLCMVRDLRAILSSMERMYRAGQEGHQAIQNHATMHGTTTAKRVEDWCNGVPVGLALERFHQMRHEGIDKQCRIIKYEDLVKYPDEVLGGTHEYLGLERYDYDFANVEQITQEDDTVYGLSPALHVVRSVVEPKTPDYKDILGRDVCAWVNKRFAWYQEAFGYG